MSHRGAISEVTQFYQSTRRDAGLAVLQSESFQRAVRLTVYRLLGRALNYDRNALMPNEAEPSVSDVGPIGVSDLPDSVDGQGRLL